MIITIDGPTASGKSSLARMLAERFSLCHINSGLLFRALVYIVIKEGKSLEHDVPQMVAKDFEQYIDPDRFQYQYTVRYGAKVLYRGIDITSYLYTQEMDHAASVLSEYPEVRIVLLRLQRMIADCSSIIIDGRDSGSVVFPDATLKFYVTASLEERARRWLRDEHRTNIVDTVAQAEEVIAARDTRDSQRLVGPLVIPEGAIIIDTTDMSQQQAFDLCVEHINRVLNKNY